MAQNITLLGASYSDVPAVDLPKAGGGTARFTDVTDTTATADDVVAGKYFYTANGTRVVGTGTDMLSAIAPERIDNTSGITDVTVSGVTVNTSPVVLRSGYTCTLDCEYTLTAALNSETTVATGLPPRIAGAIVDVMQQATSFTRPLRAIVNTSGDLKLRYGAAGKYWIHMAYISSVPNAGVADADNISY